MYARRSWKVTSVWIKHGRNGRVNFEQDLVLIHCPHSSGGCWLPDNGFVGIRCLSLERLCTLFHKCWPKQRSIQLEISVRQAQNATPKLVIMWNMTLRVCLNRSVFLLFSLSRELSPFLFHEHVLSLLVSKLCILSLHSLYKFHVFCQFSILYT